MIRLVRSVARDTAGASAVEFAIIAPVLLALILGVVQLGVLFQARAGLRHAVAEGARLAAIYPIPTDAEIIAKVRDRQFGLDPALMSNPTVVRGVSSGASYIDVAVTYTVTPNLLLFRAPAVTLTDSRRAYLADM